MGRYMFATTIVGASVMATAIVIAWIHFWLWMSVGQAWGAFPAIGGVIVAMWISIVCAMRDA